jgi:hypothetical protein
VDITPPAGGARALLQPAGPDRKGFGQQLADGDHPAVVLAHRDGGVDALAGLADGAGDGQAARTAPAFAVEGDQVVLHGPQLRVLPLEELWLEAM